jgi:hypothetical protein
MTISCTVKIYRDSMQGLDQPIFGLYFALIERDEEHDMKLVEALLILLLSANYALSNSQ